MPRSVVTHGTENQRALTLAAGYFTANEAYATTDQRRLFLGGSVLVGPVRHADVANEAAMLALNASDSRGCFPMDEVRRTDTGTTWTCISNRGADLSDWEEHASSGGVSINQRWEPAANGNPSSPEIYFDINGDVVMLSID